MPVSTEDYVRLCQKIAPDDLQHIVHPKALSTDQVEWLQWHERLDHMPCTQMRKLSQHGILPKKLSKLHSLPLCPSCAFGASKRKPWRNKDGHASIRKDGHNTPDSIVAVDQLVSKHPGLVPQSSGYLTSSIIWTCAIFLDLFANYGYAHMMRDSSQAQTLLAKRQFEREMSKHNVRVQSYRADNGRFAEKAFKDEVAKSNQIITFCGVGAHH